MKEQRWEKIVDLASKNEFITIKELSIHLNVSEMTIRRDVNYLSKINRLEKLRGGVRSTSNPIIELSTKEKINLNIGEKRYVGKIINSLIKDGDTVFLGPGTTILYGLEYIKKKNITIITNSLLVLMELRNKYRCILTGGEFLDITEEFVGTIANKSFENLNIDVSFIASNGIKDNNITTSKQLEGDIQNAAIKASLVNCLVIDSSKFDTADIYTFNHLKNIDYIITDWKLTPEKMNYYSKFVKIHTKEI